MCPLETKRSGGKLLPHSDLQRGVFLEEVSRNRKRKRDLVVVYTTAFVTWNIAVIGWHNEMEKTWNEQFVV